MDTKEKTSHETATTTAPAPAGLEHEAEHVHGPDCSHDHSHGQAAQDPYVRASPKVGRNEPCTCGSGKKWKKCCGAGAT